MIQAHSTEIREKNEEKYSPTAHLFRLDVDVYVCESERESKVSESESF